MPLKVSVGLSKKIGQPDYGSLGASCHVEFEADSTLLQQDLDGFHRHVKNAFVAYKQAVEDELHREQRPPSAASTNGSNGHHNGNGRRQGGPRRATSSQVRALESIANRLQMDLTRWLEQTYGIPAATDLSITEASQAIDALKASANGGGR